MGTLLLCWWECQMVQPLWTVPQKSMTVLQKISIELPYDPSILLLGIPKRIASRNFNTYLYNHVHSNIIHNSQKVEILKRPSVNKWINKM